MSTKKKLLEAAAGAAGEALYVEDVFSTYLYEGTSSAGNTVDNGIDLDGEGGMVWLKSRGASQSHGLFDTERGTGKLLSSDTTAAQLSYTDITSFNSNGFTLGYYSGWFNNSNYDQCSWTFRKAPKFFDVVTYTGDGANGRQISHNLGSNIGMVICKSVDGISTWAVKHKDRPSDEGQLSSTAAFAGYGNFPTSFAGFTDSYFTVNAGGSTNTNGTNYVAYLFAHNDGDGEFGEDSDQDIIKCGSYTGNSSTYPEINLGFEPQFFLVKNASSSENWVIFDVMRGMTMGNGLPYDVKLYPNTSDAESGFPYYDLTATGLKLNSGSGLVNTTGHTYIYVAIRRPMKTPESGTEVFEPFYYTSDGGADRLLDGGFTVDAALNFYRSISDGGTLKLVDRLRGYATGMATHNTNPESTRSADYQPFPQTGQIVTSTEWDKSAGYGYGAYHFRRATGFFDVVAYTGTGSNRTINHNLGVAPEMMIIKARESLSPYVANWVVYHSAISPADSINLNLNGSTSGASFQFASTAPTNSVFTLGSAVDVNMSGKDFISYHFASVDGISKVGSYTGTGADLNVDCGFSAGARFVLIKRTDSNGDWYLWDSVRGIVAGNDPYLLLNSTAAEVTSTDYIDPLSSGFTVTSSAPAALNASGGTYIFYAIA